jgi:hypothetical protein
MYIVYTSGIFLPLVFIHTGWWVLEPLCMALLGPSVIAVQCSSMMILAIGKK